MSENNNQNNVDAQLHEVINLWHKRASSVQDAHYAAGNYYEKKYLMLGMTVITLSAVVGSLEVIVPIEWIAPEFVPVMKSLSGLISLVVAILAGLQTFLKLSQRSERHKSAGARYGDPRRSLEEINILCAESTEEGKEELHRIKQQMDSLASESPELPEQILKKFRPDDYAKMHS
ncbi:SLATT domain-containing protein [Aliikangiella marina]|uniref:SLATT domain-containing protein n=1 Tax=Aliikangiella marina TaxID=1712262 RepID=A0A545T974_9GAMM|nr:SLATT domain-containing protein [Aliikangiella marina]TQV73771.1 SLATT domain-containing protein [Aliikangiella marina]